jgi:PEP-CTERM motif
MFNRCLAIIVSCFSLMVLGAGAAKADDIHLCATASACTGNAGSVQFTGSSTAFVFGKTIEPTPNELYVVVMTPVADNSGNWNSTSSSLWSVLGEAPTQSFPILSSALCALEGGVGCNEPVTGFTAQSFNVQDYLISASWSSAADTSPVSFTLPGSPTAGDLYMAFMEDGNGNLAAVSPWSSSLLNVPEPGTLTLLGLGLIGLFALSRRSDAA